MEKDFFLPQFQNEGGFKFTRNQKFLSESGVNEEALSHHARGDRTLNRYFK